jgi:hypothetical protein
MTTENLDKVKINREGRRVLAEITIYVPMLGKKCLVFPFECETEIYAALLQNVIGRMLVEAMQDIRRNAYSEGYKAGRAKAAKETWFSGRL